MRPTTRTFLAPVAALLLLFASACSGDGSDEADDTGGDESTATTEAAGDTTTTADGAGCSEDDPLQILITNDDGVQAEGIDEVTTALDELPGTEVTVVAPSGNRSGSGDRTTDGPLTATETTTASGYEAIGVDGFPADTVVWALEEGDLPAPPDLVVSGINEGQNIGPVTGISGTVGAAREAARRGIPALGVSSGVVVTGAEGEVVEYDDAVELTVEWVESRCADLAAASPSTEPADVANLNVPTCVTGELRGQVEVSVATEVAEGVNIFATDCTSTLEDPSDDVIAFTNGFAPLTELNVTELDTLIATTSVNG